MTRIRVLNERYAASALLARNGVEIIAVADPQGARLNDAVQRLLLNVRDDGPGLWDDLVGAIKALRWRRTVQPQPVEHNPALRAGVEQVVEQLRRLRGAVADEALLDEIGAAAPPLAESDPPVGDILLRSIEEAGVGSCVVVAATRSAAAGVDAWLGERGVMVFTPGELDRARPRVDVAYVVGPPRFFNSALVTSPTTGEITFVMPAWFGDRTVPRSVLAAYAEGAIRIDARVCNEGDISVRKPETTEVDRELDDQFLPQPVWGATQSAVREPTSTEVEARKVLLSGNLSVWLDDGDRIRALDTAQPAGERVIYTDIDAVQAGTYLLLRQGATERGALYEAALDILGKRGEAVDSSQRAWKSRLAERLSECGYRAVVRQLGADGVKTAERARAWVEPSLIRPHSDYDFEQMLKWLGIPIQPTFGNATLLRKTLYQASADIREELETAVSAADLSVLERDGHLGLEVHTEGFRGLLATRVLAISPYTEIVPRHDARMPFEDRSGQWLE